MLAPPTQGRGLGSSSPVHTTWVDKVEGRHDFHNVDRPQSPRCRGSPEDSGFQWLTDVDTSVDHDVESPQLWKKATSPSAKKKGTPTRAAIAQYQQEMLEMARAAPEGEYDLSFKDIVDLSPWAKGPLEEKDVEAGDKVGRAKKRAEKSSSARAHRKVLRSKSADHQGALLLKLLFPLPGGWRRSSSTGSIDTKMLQKPETMDGRVNDSGEEVEGESEVWSKGKGRSSSTGRRCRRTDSHKIWKLGSCYFFSSSEKS